MLFMASGKLVKNYSILIRYFEILEEMGIDKSTSVPASSDIEYITRAVSSGHLNLLEVLSILASRFIPRINREAARRAVEEILGRGVDEQVAVDIIAKDLAAWTLEIAENMSLIKIDTSILR